MTRTHVELDSISMREIEGRIILAHVLARWVDPGPLQVHICLDGVTTDEEQWITETFPIRGSIHRGLKGRNQLASEQRKNPSTWTNQIHLLDLPFDSRFQRSPIRMMIRATASKVWVRISSQKKISKPRLTQIRDHRESPSWMDD